MKDLSGPYLLFDAWSKCAAGYVLFTLLFTYSCLFRYVLLLILTIKIRHHSWWSSFSASQLWTRLSCRNIDCRRCRFFRYFVENYILLKTILSFQVAEEFLRSIRDMDNGGEYHGQTCRRLLQAYRAHVWALGGKWRQDWAEGFLRFFRSKSNVWIWWLRWVVSRCLYKQTLH